MGEDRSRVLEKFRAELDEDYSRRFPRSKAHLERAGRYLLDRTSHAVRWNEPFMPVIARALGSTVEDLDGHRIVDYWQGHYANLLGHNPAPIREALGGALEAGNGLQTGMVHETEAQVAELICRCTGSETVRLTTSGTLAGFHAVVLARAFTGRELVLKVAGGWHGSQPFGLKGVSAHGRSFDHVESEGLSAESGAQVLLTRFNDVEDLRAVFDRQGGRIACFVVEPVLGAGGGMAADAEYLAEARRLTSQHGALLLCDEVVTAFRFRAGDLSTAMGFKPDLLVLGKILGGGMPVAAVAGRREVLDLCTRHTGRVKFEGGTFSGHELSLIACRAMLQLVIEGEDEIYPRLGRLGERLRADLRRVTAAAGLPVHVLGDLGEGLPGSSLVLLHPANAESPAPRCPEELTTRRHPLVSPELLKSALLLEDVSVRYGLGSISTAHRESELETTVQAFASVLQRMRGAGLLAQ